MTLANVPRLQDVATMLKLIRNMGVKAESHEDGRVTLDAGALNNPEAPYELVKTMRASGLALGPLLARFGHAKVSLPGGCAIGSRPVDQHIKGLQSMGAVITVDHGYMLASLPAGRTRLKGARITTDMVTFTGPQNFMMPAAFAEAEPVPETAPQQPETLQLAEILNKIGPTIAGHATPPSPKAPVPQGHRNPPVACCGRCGKRPSGKTLKKLLSRVVGVLVLMAPTWRRFLDS